MGHPKVVAVLLAAPLLVGLAAGCAGTRAAVVKQLRDPGERLTAFPEEVWEEYGCGEQRRPFFVIEANELVPERVEPGGEFNHRLVYALCPAGPTEVEAGRLHTRIRFRGRAIVSESERYELKPGRWVVDSFVQLPESAEPGIYSFELDFDSRAVDFERGLSFLVTAP